MTGVKTNLADTPGCKPFCSTETVFSTIVVIKLEGKGDKNLEYQHHVLFHNCKMLTTNVTTSLSQSTACAYNGFSVWCEKKNPQNKI